MQTQTSSTANCVIGIDVHLSSLVCCAIWEENGEMKVEKATFGTFKNQKKAMAQWCKDHHPNLVIMESTGIYWKSPYAFLEKVGIIPAVVNARSIKQMEGKKTDMGDAEWLAHVGRLGCFVRSFVPKAIYRRLRLTSRFILNETDELNADKNRFHSILNDAGYRLSLIFSDISGVTAEICIKGILAGKTAEEILNDIPPKLLQMLKASPEEIKDALDGDLTDEHRANLLWIQNIMEAKKKSIQEAELRILSVVKELHPEAVMYLQTIPGINESSAVKILIELGGEDLEAFKTCEKLASWLGVCPGNNESAGKRKHGHIRKGNYYLRRILCECANAAARTKNTSLSSKYKSMSIRRGKKRAIVALVHTISKIIFFVLKNKAEYRDPKINYEEESAKKNAKRWVKILCTLPEWKVNATDLVSGQEFSSAHTGS